MKPSSPFDAWCFSTSSRVGALVCQRAAIADLTFLGPSSAARHKRSERPVREGTGVLYNYPCKVLCVKNYGSRSSSSAAPFIWNYLYGFRILNEPL